MDVLLRLPMRWSVGPEGYGPGIYWTSVALAAALSLVPLVQRLSRRGRADAPQPSESPGDGH